MCKVSDSREVFLTNSVYSASEKASGCLLVASAVISATPNHRVMSDVSTFEMED